MKLILNTLVISFMQFSIACGAGIIMHEENKKSFIELLHDAYIVKYKGKEFVAGFFYDRKTCIYGVIPNSISKKRIDKIYKLMTKEFEVLHPPIYVRKIKECPRSSNFFILLHEKLFNKKETKLQELNKVEAFLGRKISNNIKLGNGLASIYTRYRRGGFVFIEINQLTKYLDNHLYKSLLKVLITEELMQGVSGGSDLNIKTIRMSILQEPHLTQLPYFDSYLQNRIGSKWHLDFYKRMMKAKPTGFCSFDLWFLELARLAHKKNFILYQDFIGLWDKEFENIQSRTQKIENNTDYRELFDPRCSGENTGKNTKIGHKKYY